jgi:hypothetical protein
MHQVELTQRLNDKKTELKENKTIMDRSQTEHDKLRLEDVEYVDSFLVELRFSTVGSDEDEDEDDPQEDGGVEDENVREGQVPSTKRGKGENADPVVKVEEGVEPASIKKTRRGHNTSSNELYIFSAAELSRLNQRELLGDVQLLDGLFFR